MRNLKAGLFFGFFLCSLSAGAAEKASASGSVRPQADSILTRLEKDLKKTHPAQAQLDLIHQSVGEIANLRKKNPRQSEADELYLELLTGALKDIPAKTEFKAENCPQYLLQIRKDFEPTADKEPQDPPIRKAYRVLETVCGTKSSHISK